MKLLPSILSADFARLGEQIKAAEDAGADMIHVDVMDGHFVPNITIGPLVVEACRRSTTLPLDVHLMISQPARYIADFAEAGADGLTVHAEVAPHLHRLLGSIRERGLKAGLAVNPLTALGVVKTALPYLDRVLVMSVNPGFGGQSFIETTPERVRQVAAWRAELRPECDIEVDGGIDVQTVRRVVQAGANLIVAGSAIYNTEASVAENLRALRRAAEDLADA